MWRRSTLVLLCVACICAPPQASATAIQDFLDRVFDWRGGSAEHPRLVISKGTVIAWLPDPGSFLPDNPEAYFWNGSNRKIVIVPPGTPLLVFPPRTTSRGRALGARLTGNKFLLAVTQDGMWGVFNLSDSSLYLEEPDLQKLAAEELTNPDGASFPRFGMTVATAMTVDLSEAHDNSLPIGFTRGELFRLLRINNDSSAVADLNSNIPEMLRKKQQITEAAKKLNVKPADTFTVPLSPSTTTDIGIAGQLVPRDDITAWQKGQSDDRVPFDYQNKIFKSAFATITMPSSTLVDRKCGDSVTLTVKTSQNVEASVKASATAKVDWLSFLSFGADVSASAKADLAKQMEEVTKNTSIIERRLYAVQYRTPDQAGAFWAGLAGTCNAAPNWWTLTASGGDVAETFLHTEFRQLRPDGTEPAKYENPTKKELDEISPGGNPFDRINGLVAPLCYTQALELQRIVEERMEQAGPGTGPFRARAAIALASTRQAGAVNLQKFFSDSGCTRPK